MAKYIKTTDAITTTWMILRGMGYAAEDNPDLVKTVAYVFSTAPAADVVERKKGHYIGDFDGHADGKPVYDIWSCSECGCEFEDFDDKPPYNFCPNCGADLREE